jgi:hypothetical protein
MQWLIAGVFHFEYAALWGVLYAFVAELVGVRRLPPVVGASVLGSAIYAAAFSPIGAASVTRSEHPPEARPAHHTAVHVAAAFGFATTTAFVYRWLRQQW